jgi:hypothetical protein
MGGCELDWCGAGYKQVDWCERGNGMVKLLVISGLSEKCVPCS